MRVYECIWVWLKVIITPMAVLVEHSIRAAVELDDAVELTDLPKVSPM